jgi:hypothetical protein
MRIKRLIGRFSFLKLAAVESMALDFQGNVVAVIQVIALILLIVGLYPTRLRTKNRNLIMHGFLSILALALNLATVFAVMIPDFNESISVIGGLPVLQASVVWVHVATGVAAIILGFALVISWILHPLGELGCSKMWRLMTPTFLIWAISFVLGLIIHLSSII